MHLFRMNGMMALEVLAKFAAIVSDAVMLNVVRSCLCGVLGLFPVQEKQFFNEKSDFRRI